MDDLSDTECMGNTDDGHGARIELRGVSFSFGKLSVLDGLDLTIEAGTAYGLLGPNGSGKSTLMRLLMGRLRQTAGDIRVLGKAPSPSLTAQIGYMPQALALYPELSARENVDFFARMYGLNDGGARRGRVDAVLEMVGLEDRAGSTILTLSGGMRQRVSLACALVHEPSLLILDEPTVGLDPELRASFWERFREMSSGGGTLLISSHTMDDASHCDRLAFLHRGRVVAEGTPAELIEGARASSLEEAFLTYARGEA
jgi:ABC-2 type transport system ATP-binding protein